MSHDNVNLSTCGFNEQIPFDRMCGNIGTTLSTRYTDVPLSSASRPKAVFSFT